MQALILQAAYLRSFANDETMTSWRSSNASFMQPCSNSKKMHKHMKHNSLHVMPTSAKQDASNLLSQPCTTLLIIWNQKQATQTSRTVAQLSKVSTT